MTMGTHVVISGGSKGIGKALAIKYAHQGCNVTIIARKETDLQEAKKEIEKYRRNQVQQVRTVPLDLTKLTFSTQSKGESVTKEEQDILTNILGDQNRCDMLINCCGSASPSRFEDTTCEEFHHMMDVNYFSAINLTRLMLPVMKIRSITNKNKNRQSSCHIVFVSSMCGLLSFYGYSAYSASKFALVGLAEALQMEVQQYGINVTIAFPPDTDTPGYAQENKMKPELTAEISKSGSIYKADDVAQAIIRDIKSKRFYSTIGFDNWLAVMASNNFMPTSLWAALCQSLIAGPLKMIGYFLVRSWYNMVTSWKK